jgi:hypothetical protein
MIKLSLLSLSRLSLKNYSSNVLLRILNLAIFISIFAVSASVISLVFEKKIEDNNKLLSKEYINEIIYDHWLASAPRHIGDIERIISEIDTQNNLLVYVQAFNKKLVTERDTIHNPLVDYIRFVGNGIDVIKDSLEDAPSLSRTEADKLFLRNTTEEVKNIEEEYEKIREENKNISIDISKVLNEFTDADKKLFFTKARKAIQDLEELLIKIKKLNINLNINFYSEKKEESQNKILEIKKKVNQFSSNESNSIFIAFIIQLVIFLIAQFFEFGIEINEKLIRRKNEKRIKI